MVKTVNRRVVHQSMEKDDVKIVKLHVRRQIHRSKLRNLHKVNESRPRRTATNQRARTGAGLEFDVEGENNDTEESLNVVENLPF